MDNIFLSTLRDLKILYKLFAGLIFVFILVGVIGYIGIRGVSEVGESFEEVSDDAIPVLNSLVHLEHGFISMREEVVDYVIFGDGGDKREFQASLEHFREHKQFVIDKEGAEGGKWAELIIALEEAEEEVIRISKELFALKDAGALDGSMLADVDLMRDLEGTERVLADVLDERIEHEGQELINQELAVLATESSARISIIVFGVITILSSFVVGLFFARLISRPIQELSDVARRVGEGDLDARVNVQSSDEVGQLAESFNQMIVLVKESRAEVDRKVKAQTQKIVEQQKKAERVMRDLEEVNKAMTGRELRMVELKKEIQALKKNT